MNTSLNGFITLHRKILGWGWYDDTNTKIVFLHLLLIANFEDNEWHGITVSRGSLVTSVGSLSEQLRLSPKQIRTALMHLKASGEIKITPTNKYSIITITKYHEYQSVEVKPTDEQQSKKAKSTDKKQAKDKQETNNGQSEEIQEKIKGQQCNKGNNGNNGNKVLAELPALDGVYCVYEDLYSKLTTTYKQTDINESIKNLKAYLEANPEKRRRVNGTRSYLEMWVKGDSEHNRCRKEFTDGYEPTYDLEAYERTSIFDE